MTMHNIRTFGLGLLLVAGTSLAAMAEDYPHGTITLKVGYGAGGTFDASSRLIAPYLTKYLAGHPDIVVQNVPGGGSLKLTKLMLGAEPADGSVIASVNPSMAFAPVLDPANADYDPSGIAWLGALSNDPAFCVTAKQSGIDSIDAFLTGDFRIGATGKTSQTYQLAAIPMRALDAHFTIVTGFNNVAEIELAMERGEIQGHCVATAGDLLDLGLIEKVNVIGRLGTGVPPGFEETPRFADRIEDPVLRQAAQLIEATRDINFTLMTQDATPAPVVAALRAAYAAAVADPDFVAEAEALGQFRLDPTSGDDMAALIAGYLDADPAVVEAARKILE